MSFTDVVTIDGPVGVGKSSVSRALAEKLRYSSMDTGAMYRTVTLAAMRKNVSDTREIVKICNDLKIDLIEKEDQLQVLMNGEDVTEEIRDTEISKGTSNISDIVEVRSKLSQLQREIGKRGKYVCEGRDQGTVVFPDALWKIYLDADVRTRVDRRINQLKEKGKRIERKELEDQVKQRDYRDIKRQFGALKIADDSIIFDTSDFSEHEVIDLLYTIIDNGNKKIEKNIN